ncbi:kinesin-like protein KIN-4C [Argentina anserina]|uniref:kinesin-like protein KIN-4C n=1 Tax=Argentina anserina TaxID=57926 RepID=UPI0021765A64|nr:kinesin-like protein KIN-4C [Potentilla anserina]
MMKRGNRRSKQTADASPAAAADAGYQKRFRELEIENQAFQKEVEELRCKLANASFTSGVDNSAQELRENYLQKLTFLEDQVAVLTRKLDAQSQLSVQRRRGDESAKPFQFEMQRLKAQKVQMQCKMKLESVQFRLHKVLMDKEVLQLKKESRRNKHEILKLLASNQILKTVLHRKTEEASVATKQLRRLLESRKALLLKRGGKKGNNAATELVQEIDHEAEVTEQLNELCGVYERQIEEMAEEAAKLQEEVEALQQEKSRCSCQEKEVDSFQKDLDITDLNAQIVNLSSMVEQLRLHKAELGYGKSQDVRSQHTASVVSSSYKSAEDISPSASENSSVETSKAASPVCCSCSKYSLCKTSKCKCRSTGGSCGASCGCAASKCSNRNTVPNKPSDSPLSEIANGVKNSSNSSETVKSCTETSEGAMLLQSALVQTLAEPKENFGAIKKPLTEIGNILVSKKAEKPGPRRKGRKPAIQLVTVDPNSPLPVNMEGLKNAEGNDE